VKGVGTILPLPVERVSEGGFLPQHHSNDVLCSLCPPRQREGTDKSGRALWAAASLPLPDKVARSPSQILWIDRATRSRVIPQAHPMRVRPPWGVMATIHGNRDSAWGLLVIVRLTDTNRLFRQMTDGISKSCSP
jgi:hypothetical protein